MICRRAAALFDDGRDCGADANIAKLLASEAAGRRRIPAMQTFGGFSFAARIRDRAQVAGGAPLPDRADLHQLDPGVCSPLPPNSCHFLHKIDKSHQIIAGMMVAWVSRPAAAVAARPALVR